MEYDLEQCGAGKLKKKTVNQSSEKKLTQTPTNDVKPESSPKKIKYLYGSSSSIQKIEKIINQFYSSSQYGVDKTTLKITHPKIDVNSRVGVVEKKGRYIFGSLA